MPHGLTPPADPRAGAGEGADPTWGGSVTAGDNKHLDDEQRSSTVNNSRHACVLWYFIRVLADYEPALVAMVERFSRTAAAHIDIVTAILPKGVPQAVLCYGQCLTM